jgi:hypothetical protein
MRSLASTRVRATRSDSCCQPCCCQAAIRRNLGRALRWIKDELPGMPDFFEFWKDGGAWRYQVIEPVRAAARRRGMATG